ncbi:type I-F CRISPR-associated protein Csy1 [Desulfobacter sp.]|uniref:type I-F CRISPR-associated protein Csy1 n=1 Tax=Desulfobacter sp. TaxID=2294 RepID=UPI003D0DA391
MIDPAIQEFFQKRKDDWLKNKLKQAKTEEEIQLCNEECANKFSLGNWLPNAAKRAGQISISSHPCTFSHPSARKNKNGYVAPIIAKAKRLPDGYLRAGNVDAEHDALGNAAAIDVYKFLTLSMKDGKTLLQHIETDSDLARELLSINTETYENLKEGFMAMVCSDPKSRTSSKIKQVYFPVDDEYHLLSVLSNSGLIFKLRSQLNYLRFSDEQKDKREKKYKGEFLEHGFAEIFDLTTIGYGGTKPQNISILNNQNGGKANLFLSTPPHLDKRSVHFPRKNFFTNSIWYRDIREPLNKLHGIFKTGLNSKIPRRNLENGRDHRVEELLDIIIERSTVLRSVAEDQYREESSTLPEYQKIWLCHGFEQPRKEQDEWLDTLCAELAKWIAAAYAKVIKKPVMLGPIERDYLKTFINLNREALR